MTAAEKERFKLLDEGFSYAREVKNILNSAENPLSAEDIRLELDYGENGFERPKNQGSEELENYVVQALSEIKKEGHRGELELERYLDLDTGAEFYSIVG